MHAHFLLGEINITPAAKRKLGRIPLDLVARHAVNEHGKITHAECKRNIDGYLNAGPIMSRYRVDPLNPRAGNVVVLTDDGWLSTTVKLESE